MHTTLFTFLSLLTRIPLQLENNFQFGPASSLRSILHHLQRRQVPRTAQAGSDSGDSDSRPTCSVSSVFQLSLGVFQQFWWWLYGVNSQPWWYSWLRGVLRRRRQQLDWTDRRWQQQKQPLCFTLFCCPVSIFFLSLDFSLKSQFLCSDINGKYWSAFMLVIAD